MDQKRRLNFKSEFEFVPEEIPKTPRTLEYSSDPSRWTCFSKQELILIRIRIRILILMINAHKLQKGYDVNGLSSCGLVANRDDGLSARIRGL